MIRKEILLFIMSFEIGMKDRGTRNRKKANK